ncbi:single-stranded DNA-binding protein [Paraburkholderia sp. Cpub6]|uniref:single-stranded DNA-binding protein n=1 Tax=Paraburkholderia sp. Cpub6 TaxID=2723094 RepID=UPI00161E6DB9|nr:single-stranded DNA-binding protein [Paraburkholderia sp. Cpub6]MBB5456900.1 single-stranded DNA-binding protein [Paraburkholderia sp. Cpub6]
MITALIAGKLYGTPILRTSRDGKHRFATAKMRVAQDGADALFVNLVCFGDTAKAALLALDDGDALAAVGTLKLSVWTDGNGTARPQVSMTADRIESTYTVERKRRISRGEDTDAELAERKARPQRAPATQRTGRFIGKRATPARRDTGAMPDDTLDDVAF